MSDIKVKTEEITSSSAASQSQEQNEVKIEATTTEASADTPSSSVDLKLQEPPVKNLTVVKETYLYDGSGKPNLIEYSSSAQSSSSAANIRPTKKAKIEKNKEEYFLEIRWLKDFDSMDEPRGERNYYYSMFADEIRRGKFSNSHPFTEEYKGEGYTENHEYRLDFYLVDGKGNDRKVLVEIGVFYWKVAITLMHFHILSQDLANFCGKLWEAAGKNVDEYSDMDIEFGNSKHSHVPVKSLVSKAMGIKGKSDILYVNTIKMHPGGTSEHSLKLIEMIFKTCSSALVIAYESDLKGLGVDGKAKMIGFNKMRNYCCYIGPNRKF